MEKNQPVSAENRILHLKITAWEIGFAMGRALGSKLEQNIILYLQKRPASSAAMDVGKLRAEALQRMHHLPLRLQEELAGLAEGARLPFDKMAHHKNHLAIPCILC